MPDRRRGRHGEIEQYDSNIKAAGPIELEPVNRIGIAVRAFAELTATSFL
jgi:hypothetical protein